MTQTKVIHLEDWPVMPVGVPGSLVVWRKRLAEARERGEFTGDDKSQIMNFRTCAVGEYLGFPTSAREVSRQLLSHPRKDEVENLGCNAAKACADNNFDRFESILSQLEALKEKENPS